MEKKINYKTWLPVIGAMLLVSGCATTPTASVVPAPETHLAAPASLYHAPAPAEGSLWTDAAPVLFLDQRARRVGDTVTVDIVENNSSSVGANTQADRTSSLDAGVPNLLGYIRSLEASNKNLNQGGNSNLVSANLTSKFQGKGSSDRSGKVTASIGARVTEVLPNGNLVIYGGRETKVNNEVQYIRVSGVIRPDDIGSDNRIQSVYIADAHIEYFGKGVLADQQQPGWLARALYKIWPF
jgi:flagellar L-ring protein precursor FlgH